MQARTQVAKATMVMILRRTTSTRQLAALMLFVWLFALAAGIVNACALGQAPGRHANLALSEPAEHGHEHAGADDSAPVPAPACLKFCDDERSTLNLPVKDPGSAADLLSPPQQLQPTLLAWTSGEGLAPLAPLAQPPYRETGPPIPIRFLRLTI